MTPSIPITQRVKELTGSRKKSFYLDTSTSYCVSTGWSGGSRSYYSLKNFKTGADIPLEGVGDQFSKHAIAQDIPTDAILVETGVFCGKPMAPRITCRPEQLEEVRAYLGAV